MLRLLPPSLVVGALALCASHAWAEPEAKRSADKHIQVLEYSPRGDHPSIGSESAPVTMEFFFNVGNARSVGHLELMQELAAKHPKRLRIIFRLTDNSERSSSLAQIFAQEAFVQGRFFDFLREFYAQRRGPAANKDFPEVAEAAGVNYVRVTEAMESGRHDEFLLDNHYYWRRNHVPLVPGILVNGHRPARMAGIYVLEQLYDEAYQESMSALASGVKQQDLPRYLRSLQPAPEVQAGRLSGPVDREPGELEPKSPRTIRMQDLLLGAHSQGPSDAKVTLIFVCHLQSSNCRTMSRSILWLQRSFQDDIRIVVHPYFDSELPRQDKAQLMHEAARCADEQGAYWEYYRLAFEKQRQLNFDQGFALDLAGDRQLDLNVENFQSCLESGRHTQAVQDAVALVKKAGVTHVPALAIGGLLYTGRLHFDQLRSLVEAELAPGLLGSGRGALDY